MTSSTTIAIIAAIIAFIALLWQIVIYVRGRRKRIKIRVFPRLAPDEASWSIDVEPVNRGHNTEYIARVHIEHMQKPAWYIDLKPGNDGEVPRAIPARSYAVYTIDGERTAKAVAEFNSCECVVTTSDRVYRHPLRSKGEIFLLKCLIASLTVNPDDISRRGSASREPFPWAEEVWTKRMTDRELHWKLGFLTSKGWIETKRIDGEERIFATEEGRKALENDLGEHFPLNDIFRGRYDRPARSPKFVRTVITIWRILRTRRQLKRLIALNTETASSEAGS